MALSEPIRRLLLTWARRRMRRAPDRIIGTRYLRRWHIIPRNPVCNVYLHEFQGSDDDRALHDHPWSSCSIILDGWYLEHKPAYADDPAGTTVCNLRDTGDITLRGPKAAHRIEIMKTPALTLFITGWRRREWGFWCPKGWRHWKQFTDPDNPDQIGPGCD